MSGKQDQNICEANDPLVRVNRRISKGSINRKIWTASEDKLLASAIQNMGTTWKDVAKVLKDRNPSQCAQRWKRIKPSSHRSRNQWTPAEDKQLSELVKIHKRNWGLIASMMERRTGKQIRERFINKLNPEIKSDAWSKSEDMIILKAYKKIGSKWTDISKLLVGRPENMIKNRFYSYIRKEYMHIENPYYIVPPVPENPEIKEMADSLDIKEEQLNADHKIQNVKQSVKQYKKNKKYLSKLPKLAEEHSKQNEFQIQLNFQQQNEPQNLPLQTVKEEADNQQKSIQMPTENNMDPSSMYQYILDYQTLYQSYYEQFMQQFNQSINTNVQGDASLFNSLTTDHQQMSMQILMQPFQNLLTGSIVNLPVYVNTQQIVQQQIQNK